MAAGNWELMRVCFPKHSRMGTARMKYDKETNEEGKKRGVSKSAVQRTSKNEVMTANTTQSKYNNKHNFVVFYEIWNKYNEIELTINKMEEKR